MSQGERGFWLAPEQRHLIKLWRDCTSTSGLDSSGRQDIVRAPVRSPRFGHNWARAVANGFNFSFPAPSIVNTLSKPTCGDEAYATLFVTSPWGNTYLSRVGASSRGGGATNTSGQVHLCSHLAAPSVHTLFTPDEQVALFGSLLVTLVQSVRHHELCVRPYVLLTGKVGPH